MAIIGDGDSVTAFTAGGIDAYPVSGPNEAGELVKKLARTYQIIFITDVLAKEIDDLLKRYLTDAYPIILSVPSGAGSNGYGIEGLKKSMDKALGVDILFNNNDSKEE